MESLPCLPQPNIPWNKGKIVGQKPALKLHEVWAIRTRLQMAKNVRDLALFNVAIDSKLQCCDLVKLKVSDVKHGTQNLKRAIIIQQKTKKPVQFEITEQTRSSILDLLNEVKLNDRDYLFKSCFKESEHLSTRHYASIVKKWVTSIGLEPMEYGIHSLRRTKPSLIYIKTKNLRANGSLNFYKRLALFGANLLQDKNFNRIMGVYNYFIIISYIATQPVH